MVDLKKLRIGKFKNVQVVNYPGDIKLGITPATKDVEVIYGNGNSYDTPNWITFTPSSSLQPNTKYTVTVGTGVKDVFGVRMKEQYSFSFVTRPS